MQPSMSSAHVPQPGGPTAPKPTAPTLVPPAPRPARRRTGMFAGLAAAVAVVGGLVYYFQAKTGTRTPGGPEGIVVRTAAVDAGELQETIRVTGVISAERFAAVMAPQIRGSRSGRGRGGMGGGGGSTATGTDTSSSSTGSSLTSASSSSTSSSSTSSTSTSSLGAQRGTTNRFNDSAAVNKSKSSSATSSSSSSSGGAGRGSTASSLPGANSGSWGGNDFTLVLVFLADAGSHVKKGAVVAEFDSQYQVLRRDDYNDSVVQKNANIKKMKADLAATKEAHDQQVRSAKAAWDKAELDLKTIAVRSAIEAENFRLNAEQAKAQYQQMLGEVKLLEESQRAQIKAAEIDRDQAKIELQRAENNVQRMTIRAPIDGIVVMQSIFRGGDFGQIKQGDQVWSGQFFMSIVDPSSMVLNGTVNQVDAELLRLGAKAQIQFDAYPELEATGTVVGVGAMAKVSVFRASYVAGIPVRVKLDRVEQRIIPDLTASADIVLRGEKDAVIAPRAGVFQENGGSFVFLQSPTGWIRKDVELGLGNHVAVTVRSGLQKGDVIALQRPL